MRFGIAEKMTKDCVSLCNNAGLICEVSEEIARENAENCHCRQHHCRLTLPAQGNSANNRINRISPETRVIGLYLCDWQYGSIFMQISVVGFERRIFAAIHCAVLLFKVIQGRWFWHQSNGRLGLVVITLIVTLVPSCTFSEIRRLIGWKLQTFPIPLSFNALARCEPCRISGWTFLSPRLSLGYPSVKISVPACDRRTDIPIVVNTGLSMLTVTPCKNRWIFDENMNYFGISLFWLTV